MKKYLIENKYSYYDYELTDWQNFCLEHSFEKYRAKQITDALYHGKNSPEKFTNLPIRVREAISEHTDFKCMEVIRRLESELDGTVKYLFKLFDGAYVEAVLMFYKYGASLCISTQVGCAMGCEFCASAKLGLERNLSAGEMLEQVCLISSGEKVNIHNVVLMGIGEPLDNLANVLRFIDVVSRPDVMNIGKRRISVSTCGLPEQIKYLASIKPQFTLSISIHAADQEKRAKIMPIARKYDLDTLLAACRHYLARGGKRISFEYIMLKGFNDGIDDAVKLAELLKGMLAHVNLIPTNEIPGSPFHASRRTDILKFKEYLEKKGISCTVRRSLGQDIMAACGQLRKKQIESE